jgi:Death domain
MCLQVIYQLLRMWAEKNGPDATIDKLTKALSKENQYEALQTLHTNYSQE